MHGRDRTRKLPEPTPDSLLQDAEDRARHQRCLAYVRQHAAGRVEGLYGPGSVTWEMWREPLLLMAGAPAVLLQLLHPAIATGVGRLSNFQEDILGRARRTFSSLYQLVFGDLDDVLAASGRLHTLHTFVRGTIEDPGGPLDGIPYRANDQRLLRWVGVTVAMLGRDVFERLVRPLTPAERETWYAQYRITAASTGVAPEMLPPTVAELDAWFESELDSVDLRITPLAREVAGALLNSAVTRGPFDEIVCAALLPPRWREAFGLRWGPAERATWAAMSRALRLHHRLTPAPLRAATAWHQAHLRVARAKGEREPVIGRMLNAVDRRVNLPFSIQPIAEDIEDRT